MKITVSEINWDITEFNRNRTMKTTVEELQLPTQDTFVVDGTKDEYTQLDVEGFIEDYLSDVYGFPFSAYSYRVDD